MARVAVAAAFALALSVRLLVPAGFMPTQTPQGLVAKICGGVNNGEMVIIDLAPEDHGNPDPEHRAPDQPCAFSALSTPAFVVEAVPSIVAPDRLHHPQVLPPPAGQAVARADFITPPLRGPPLHS